MWDNSKVQGRLVPVVMFRLYLVSVLVPQFFHLLDLAA